MPELKELVQHMNAARNQGSKALWNMALAETVLELLKRDDTISRSSLVAALKNKAAFEGNSENLKDAFLKAAHLIEAAVEKPTSAP